MRIVPLAGVLLLLITVAAAAEPRFRADDGNLWHLEDNPALAAVSGDLFTVGTAFTPEDGRWDSGTQDLVLRSPLLSFHYSWNTLGNSLRFGSALGPWQGLSLGYRSESLTLLGSKLAQHHFGLLWRPFDLASAGLTLDDAFGPSRQWGLGLGVRPFDLVWPRADWLTLTGDLHWSGSEITLEQAGARFSWRGSDLRVWYDPKTGLPGLEATLTLGPGEASASPTRAGVAARWTTRTPELAAFGPVVLRLVDLGDLASAPTPTGLLSFGQGAWNLPELVTLLSRAANDSRVQAVAFENPPRTGGLADSETLRLALQDFQKRGKKVYVQADSFGDSLGFQGWMSAADRLSLDPSGSLGLVSSGSRRLYLKGFLDKLGVRFVNFAPWETKSANNTLSFSSMPEGEKAMLLRFLVDRDDQAASLLAKGRGEKLKDDASALVARGPYLMAKESKALGLIDELENRADFEAFLRRSHPGASLTDTLPAVKSTSWGPPLSRLAAALVHLSGDIVLGPGQAGRSIGRDAAETLAGLRDDPEIRAVVLRVDSPGGAVLPSDALADEVRKTVAAGKPVLVLMGNVAASGGYYLSAPATRIWAQPGTITGSIGVTAALFTAEKALELVGIRADGVDLAPSAAFGDWTRNPTEADSQRWSAMILATYDRFLDVVATGRHLDKEKLEPLARGQVYTGREALDLGLVDELGGQSEAQAWLEKELKGSIEWREYTPGQTAPWGGLLGPLATTALSWADSPTLRLAATLEKAAGPVAQTLAGMAARGPGPVVWLDLLAY